MLELDSIFKCFDEAWEASIGKLSSPDFLEVRSNNLEAIIRKAEELGLFFPEESSISEKRSSAARRLARLLIRYPTRTQILANISPEEGILSSQRRGASARFVFEQIQNAEDRVHFTFGPPYFFDSYARKDLFNQMALAVINGEKILGRPDLQIPFMDTGLLFKACNPLAEVIRELEEKHPYLLRSDNDPTKLLYEYILRDPERNKEFSRWMGIIYPNFCLDRTDLPSYLETLLCFSFPFEEEDEKIARRWRTIRSPEGNVTKSIDIDEIDFLIVSESVFGKAKETFPSSVPIINAGNPYSTLGERSDNGGISNLHLLESYAEVIGAKKEFEFYIKFLKEGRGSY